MGTEKRKAGRPRGRNFEILKRIRINEKQDKNWNRNTSKLIRDLLEGKFELDTQILKKMIVLFVEKGLKIDTTTEIEDKRIMELIDECL